MLGLGLSHGEAVAETRRAEERVRARLDWIRALFDALHEAHERCSDACAKLSEEELEDDELELPELAEAELIERAIAEVREGRWPRHLHWPQV